MEQFTANEVVTKLRERFTSGNDVPVPDVRLTRAEFDAFADLLEAREKAVPVAYAAGLEANMRGFLDVMAWSEGEFTIPLYTHPAPADAERLAEALRQAAQSLRTIERGAMREEGLEDAENVRAYARSRADVAGNALAAHSTQAQPPAASVPDAIARRMVAEYDAVLCGDPTATRTDGMRAALEVALATQENPNG